MLAARQSKAHEEQNAREVTNHRNASAQEKQDKQGLLGLFLSRDKARCREQEPDHGDGDFDRGCDIRNQAGRYSLG